MKKHNYDDLHLSTHRKGDHIHMALASQTIQNDKRFSYEPMLGHMDLERIDISTEFLGKTLQAPIWISSMTGGTDKANLLNHRLAKAANQYGIGMGLGSCRSLLDSDEYFEDFNLRPILGDNLPLFANLGIAQIEKLIDKNEIHKISQLIEKLKADGLIVHINPLQEWYQPEGDVLKRTPLETLDILLESFKGQIIVKEVGQGFGPGSLYELMRRPIAAIDFGAFGGTNFSQIENQRSASPLSEELVYVGQTADEMVDSINDIEADAQSELLCKKFIISGGVKSFLDGHFFMEKLAYSSIYAQASQFLKYALIGEQELNAFVESQIDGLKMAKSFLRLRQRG